MPMSPNGYTDILMCVKVEGPTAKTLSQFIYHTSYNRGDRMSWIENTEVKS